MAKAPTGPGYLDEGVAFANKRQLPKNFKPENIAKAVADKSDEWAKKLPTWKDTTLDAVFSKEFLGGKAVQEFAVGGKVPDKLAVLEPAFEKMYTNPTLLGDKAYELIGFLTKTMGWEESVECKNPKYMRMVVKLLNIALAQPSNLSEPKNLSALELMLPWLVESLSKKAADKEIQALVKNVAWAFGPEPFLTRMLNRLALVTINKGGENTWSPMVDLCANIVEEFGVHNCNPLHHIHRTQLLYNAAKSKGKAPCEKLFTVMYQQLGQEWQKAIYGTYDKKVTGKWEKQWATAVKNPGNYVQKRSFNGEKQQKSNVKKTDKKEEKKKSPLQLL